MPDSRSFSLPPHAAKPRPISVEPVRAAASGYAVAMTRTVTARVEGPKRAGPKPRYAHRDAETSDA